MPQFDYPHVGSERILRLLRAQHAAVWPEIEARLADRSRAERPTRIEPHHLTTARHMLLDAGHLVQETARTTGGYEISTFRLADHYRDKTRGQLVAARRRKLHARYRSWASGHARRYPHGLIGPALEQVVARAINAHPRITRAPEALVGNVRAVFGTRLEGGSIDLLADLIAYDAQRRPRAVTLLIETKNIRSWVYPRHQELYGLLYKAAKLQQAHPDELILPVLICRRRQHTTLVMGKDLGFYVIEVHRQPITAGSISTRHLQELNDELAFDLVPTTALEPLPRLRQALGSLPTFVADNAQTWRDVGVAFVDHYDGLRDDTLPNDRRAGLLDDLREDARMEGLTGLWTAHDTA